MGKVAFVFSGQGDQFPGMGQNWYAAESAAKAVFDRCDGIRPGTSAQCFTGTAEELKETKNTQPCLFALELAAAKMLEEKGVIPQAVAGFSLGEVVAATVAGCFDEETGFRLVCRRGQLMQEAAQEQDTAMVAVVKLTEEQVTELCEGYSHLYPVNFNCPGNITVSGLAQQIQAFSGDVKAAGGRALPLKVKGAFHSPFMHSAAQRFYEELKQADMHPMEKTLYSNVTAQPYTGEGAKLLAQQIENPVRWERLIRNMIADGVDTFVEIGPGRTLTNMIKKIDPSVTAKIVTEVLEEMVCSEEK